MKCLITGGGGFVGRALGRRMRQQGWDVVALARGSYPDLGEYGIESIQADIGGLSSQYIEALEGVDAVFHVASKVAMWGRHAEFERINVLGTKNLLHACIEKGVKKFIYTSSPSVVANGEDLEGVDESQPYPDSFEAFYPKSKAEAEQFVLSMNGTAGLQTIALRPHLIFGPGDTNLIPTILQRAKAGRLVRVGNGSNLVDFTFIDDCVSAHVAALKALDENPNASGKAYFISQGEPTNMWDWINEVLVRSGLEPVRREIPIWLALSVARLAELVCKCLPTYPEPPLSSFLVSEMSTHHYFDISAARDELGYSPKYTIAEALDLTFPKKRGESVGNPRVANL